MTPRRTDADWMFEVVFDYGEGTMTMPPTPAGRASRRAQARDAGAAARPTRSPPTAPVRGPDLSPLPARADVPPLSRRAGSAPTASCARPTSTTAVVRQCPGRSPAIQSRRHAVGFRIARPRSGVPDASLPPLEFDYSQAGDRRRRPRRSTDSLENLPSASTSAYQWVDLDGEGLSGVLTEQGGAWFYKRNLGDGAAFGAGDPARVARRAVPPLAASPGAQLLDLAGDGQLDLVVLGGPDARVLRARRGRRLGSRSAVRARCRTSTGATRTCASSI